MTALITGLRGISILQTMIIKRPADNDYLQIFYLLDRAFAASILESNLVKKLRDHQKISFDFIIEKKGKVVAYICYSTAYDDRKIKIGYHLAPIAVLPEKQRQGLGQQIIKESLKIAGTSLPVYILGDPEYYKRTGFRIDKTQKCAFDPEGAHFMVHSREPLPARDVFYEDEFME